MNTGVFVGAFASSVIERVEILAVALVEPDALVVALVASSVTLRVRWWIEPPRRADALDTQDAVLVAVKQALLAHGIDLPFPTQQILWHDQTDETDGDRARQREGWPAGTADVPKPRGIAGALQHLAAERSERDGNRHA